MTYKLANPELNKIVKSIIENTHTTDPFIKKLISSDVFTAFTCGEVSEIKKAIKKLEDL